jgi:hypothetical protein
LGGGYLGKSSDSENLYASARTSFQFNLTKRWAIHAEWEVRDCKVDHRHIAKLQSRIEIAPQMDIRAHYIQIDDQQEIGASMGFYW